MNTLSFLSTQCASFDLSYRRNAGFRLPKSGVSPCNSNHAFHNPVHNQSFTLHVPVSSTVALCWLLERILYAFVLFSAINPSSYFLTFVVHLNHFCPISKHCKWHMQAVASISFRKTCLLPLFKILIINGTGVIREIIHCHPMHHNA